MVFSGGGPPDDLPITTMVSPERTFLTIPFNTLITKQRGPKKKKKMAHLKVVVRGLPIGPVEKTKEVVFSQLEAPFPEWSSYENGVAFFAFQDPQALATFLEKVDNKPVKKEIINFLN
jgi:hypothetical protein